MPKNNGVHRSSQPNKLVLPGNVNANGNAKGTAMIKMLRVMGLLLCAGWAWSAKALPITDTVDVAGVEWAQPAEFTNLKWGVIKQACPLNVCAGQLSSFDMSGWRWADTVQVNGLFNSYLIASGVTGTDLLMGPDNYRENSVSPLFSSSFFTDFRTTSFPNTFEKYTWGWSADRLADGNRSAGSMRSDRSHTHEARTNDMISFTVARGDLGAWFYRSAPAEISLPPSTLLLVAALAGLFVSSRFRQ